MVARKASDAELLDYLTTHTQAEAAQHFGLNKRTVERRAKALALKGYSPKHGFVHPLPEPFIMERASVLYRRGEDEPLLQWIKAKIDPAQLQAMLRALAKAMAKDLPRVRRVKAPRQTLAHLMAVYPIGDAHIGMRAWGTETQGASWDLAEAERVQCGAMAALVEQAPAADQAVIINLGDWFHADNMAGMTERSGHVMDLDGRYAKMISVGVKVMRQCITSALAKHRTVRVINVIGNHDDTGALWLSVALRHTYEREPRVIIDDLPTAFHYFEHGKCLVGCHHGHTCKPDRLPGVMAADQAEAWGRTVHRYWYLGHVHHQSVREFAGVVVESFNTLTAKDAYAAFGGYRARQNMKCIVLHDEHGEVARFTIHPDMLA